MLNADIVILPEIHCLPHQNIEIENYTLYQNKRKMPANSRKGSGGIAIAIKTALLSYHDVIGIFTNVDGQIGLKLKNTKSDIIVGVIGLYLSPDNYQYGRDPEGFFNNAAVLWEDFSDCDLLVGSGDLNSRTKEALDFIPEIDGDLIPLRSNPDKTKNAHGNCFLTFLKETRAIILNGRVTPNLNNFTFVSPNRGCSVPDYHFCPVDQLQYCKEMKTLLISEIVNEFGLHPPLNLPDHSILVAAYCTSSFDAFRTSNASKNININFNEMPSLPTRPHKKNLIKNQ